MTSALLPVYDRDITLVKGKGSRLWDTDGREWLDFAAGIAVNGFGYGDRKIVAAIKKQAEKLIHASNLFHTEPGERRSPSASSGSPSPRRSSSRTPAPRRGKER